MSSAKRSFVARALRVVTEPSPALAHAADRTRARLLAGLLVVLVPIGLASGLVQWAWIPGFGPTFLRMSLALGGLTIAYALSRSRRYRAGVWLAAGVITAACIAVGLSNPDDRVWYAFLVLAPVLAATLLSTIEAAAVASIVVGAIAVVALASPSLGRADRFLPALMFHLVFSPLLLLVTWYRGRIDAAATRELRERERQLLEIRRLETVGRLASGIAHDFNNLLTVVRANVDLLQRSNRIEEERLFEIAAATDRGGTLTRQLLTFARKQEIERCVVDVNRVIGGVGGILERLLDARARLCFDLAADLGKIEADEAQIEQVVVNLCLNARDAMPGGGEVTVATRNADLHGDGAPAPSRSGRFVVLSVRDVGVGMDEAMVARVFDPFFTTKAPGEGTGLGLATVHGIVTGSGGFMRVTSRPGAGSTFDAYFPRARGSEDGKREPGALLRPASSAFARDEGA